MGIASSKDETGAVVAGSLRGKDILDYKGRDLRDKMDVCLSKHMWYWTIGGVVLSLPMCVILKTQRPLFFAALVSPIADMMYATNKCDKEKEVFRLYYNELKKKHAEMVEQGFSEGSASETAKEPLQTQPTPEPNLPGTSPDADAVGGLSVMEAAGRDSEMKFDDGLSSEGAKKKKGWLW